MSDLLTSPTTKAHRYSTTSRIRAVDANCSLLQLHLKRYWAGLPYRTAESSAGNLHIPAPKLSGIIGILLGDVLEIDGTLRME